LALAAHDQVLAHPGAALALCLARMGEVLRARWIDEAAYAPYGSIVRARAGAPPREANHGRAQAWDGLARVLNPRGDAAALEASLFRCLPYAGEVVPLSTLERHPRSTQLFAPMWSGERAPLFLVVVALGDAAPDLATLRAFAASGATAITYHAGVWHHPMIALGAAIDFVNLVSPDGAEKNCEELDVAARGLTVALGDIRTAAM